jgi:hypothetical protein
MSFKNMAALAFLAGIGWAIYTGQLSGFLSGLGGGLGSGGAAAQQVSE